MAFVFKWSYEIFMVPHVQTKKSWGKRKRRKKENTTHVTHTQCTRTCARGHAHMHVLNARAHTRTHAHTTHNTKHTQHAHTCARARTRAHTHTPRTKILVQTYNSLKWQVYLAKGLEVLRRDWNGLQALQLSALHASCSCLHSSSTWGMPWAYEPLRGQRRDERCWLGQHLGTLRINLMNSFIFLVITHFTLWKLQIAQTTYVETQGHKIP